MIPVGLDYLAEMYDQVQTRKKEIRDETRARYKARADEEIARQVEMEDARIGVAIVKAVEQGYKRADIAKLIKTNDSAKYRRYVELGGGTIRTRMTTEEREQIRSEGVGVDRLAENLFALTLSTGEVVEVYVRWKDGKPYIWTDGSMINLSAEYNGNQSELYRKGAEIVAAFGLEED